MAVDYRINLSKDMTSSEEERGRFYNFMLIYLVSCAAVLVYVAYLACSNLMAYAANKKEQSQLLSATTAVAGVNVSAYKNSDSIYNDLQSHSGRIRELKQVLSQQVQLLPIVHNLFLELPDGVVLQSLSANKNKIAFGLTMPPSEDSGDPVRDLRASWEANEELMKSVASIRPVTGERRTIGSRSVFYVQFECILNK